jgi:hypothetical protein
LAIRPSRTADTGLSERAIAQYPCGTDQCSTFDKPFVVNTSRVPQTPLFRRLLYTVEASPIAAADRDELHSGHPVVLSASSG